MKPELLLKNRPYHSLERPLEQPYPLIIRSNGVNSSQSAIEISKRFVVSALTTPWEERQVSLKAG